MSSFGYPPAPFPVEPVNGSRRVGAYLRPSRRDRLWLNTLLFLLTFLTTTAVGAHLSFAFRNDIPAFAALNFDFVALVFRQPAALLLGLPFSLTLLGILLAHELGHYLACRYYGVDATLPFFIPAPTLIGTLGAFIRIRSPIFTKRALFDIGVAGPLAGFVFVLPALAVGLAWSKVIPGVAEQGELIFGVPLLQNLLAGVIFPGVSGADIYLHPVARAAWVGVLATALNLLPIGQLDGGHILYSFVGRHHRLLSRLFILALVPIGLFYSYSWLVWAVILLVLGMRHPSIHDKSPIGTGRKKLGFVALVMFVVCFSLIPVRVAGGL